MTDITPLIPEGRKIVKSYGDGGFNISGEQIKGSIILLPEEVLGWAATTPEALEIGVFKEIIKRKDAIEVLLLGTGEGLVPPPREIVRELKFHNIIVDVMDSGAACRTYNVLLSEERLVAAAIIAV